MLKNEIKDIVSETNYQKYKKWYNNYIEGVNLADIEWKKFNFNELMCFLHKNYYDEDYESFVMVRDESNNFLPIGMTYLTFNKLDTRDEYLLGLVTNNQGLKTIAACMIFKSKCLLESDSIKPVTYIETVEVNRYFQRNGLFTKMIRVLSHHIDNNQNIIITPDEGMGCIVGINEKIKRILIEQGFVSDIRDEYKIDEEYLTSLKKVRQK